MKEGFTIWIPDDAEIQGINIVIVVKDSKDSGVTFFNLADKEIKDYPEWYFMANKKALPVRNGEC